MSWRSELSPQSRLHQENINLGYTSWTDEHKVRYKSVGTMPFLPRLLPDQRIDRPSRQISRLSIFLPETAYIKTVEASFAKAVGSRALAETMITAFDLTPVSVGQENISLTDHSIECLEDNISFTTTTAHIDRLTDIAEFNQALSLAVARRVGRKYMSQFKVVINKNMTRETFYKIPTPWLATIGQGVYWGSPSGESAERHGINEGAIQEINNRFMQQYVRDKRKSAVALAVVPAQSGLVKSTDAETDEEFWRMKDASSSAPLLGHSEGGIIPGNRYEDSVVLGSVISVLKERPKGITKSDYNRQLADTVALELATQTFELTGMRVQYDGQMVGELPMDSTSRGSYPEQ